MTKFNVSVTSDTVCPWCYVGARKLEAGIAAYRAAHPPAKNNDNKKASNEDSEEEGEEEGDSFSVTWEPFLLNPDAPREGVDKRAYYESRFGTQRTAAMLARLAAEGAKVGIDFDFGGRTGSTRDSHRVIALARRRGGERLQNAVVRQLFRAYFEEQGDITSRDMLVDAATEAGLNRDAVARCLDNDDDDDNSVDSVGYEVDQRVERARRGLVTGVPNFVINGKYEIQGAQDPEGFKRVFEKIKEMDG